MWISGRRGDDDPERRRCVKANPAQKRSALRYTNRRLVPLPSLLRRETEEYDLGSSSGASSSRSSLTPVKREPEEPPPPLRVVKREPETDAEPEGRAGGVVGPEDFLAPAEADAIKAAILAHSAREEEEELQRRWREEEIDAVLYEQGLAKALAFDEKEEEWRHEKIEQEKIYVDLTSDED